MIEKSSQPYAITRLTDYGRQIMLEDNTQFQLTHYALTDEEVLYNLFNSDNKTKKGFDRVNQDEEDNIDDVKCLPILDPATRIVGTVDKYLFGNRVFHKLEASDITNENDLEADMSVGYLDKDAEQDHINKYKKFNLTFKILSGKFPDFLYNSYEDFLKFNAVIDIRTRIIIYGSTKTTDTFEESNSIQKLVYRIDFVSTDKRTNNFSITKEVGPNESITLNGAELMQQYGIDELYGAFYIHKLVVISGQSFMSEIIPVVLKRPEVEKEVLVINAKQDILQTYSQPYVKKFVNLTFPYQELTKFDPKIYNIPTNDSLAYQKTIAQYSVMDQTIPITLKSSNLNSLHLNIRQVATNRVENFLTIEGSKNDLGNYITIPNFIFHFTIRKQQYNDDIYFITSALFPDRMGLLELDDVNKQNASYILLGDVNHNFNITINPSLNIGKLYEYDTMDHKYRLWELFTDDHDIVPNFYQDRPLTLDDVQRIILFI